MNCFAYNELDFSDCQLPLSTVLS